MSIPSNQYDIIVVGVGGMGSATAYQLAKRGDDVVGIEQYDIPHTIGSSYGDTRILQRTFYENPSYVPLLQRASELWEQIELEYGEQMLYKTGSVSASLPSSKLVMGAIRACEEHSLSYEKLSSEVLSQRFSAFNLPSDFEGIYQPDGGFIDSAKAITAFVELAHSNGADIRAREKVKSWQSTTDGVQVITDKEKYTADRLVITAGAWTGQLVESYQELFSPVRQVVGWFKPKQPDLFSKNSLPVFNLGFEDNLYEGTPIYKVPGVKIGFHNPVSECINPELIDHEPTEREQQTLRNFVKKHIPNGAGPIMRLQTCMYTTSPSHDLIIDTLPNHPEVIIAGGFSGRDFKFASVVGEIIANLTEDSQTSNEKDLYDVVRL